MREGLIPTILGTGVTATGLAMKSMSTDKRRDDSMLPMVAAGVIGFGLAHVILGAIDLIED